MRFLTIAIMTIGMAVSGAWAQEPATPYVAHGIGNFSCKKVLATRKDPTSYQQAEGAEFIDGYLSAFEVLVLKGKHAESFDPTFNLWNWVTGYCLQNPAHKFYRAADALTAEMHRRLKEADAK